MTYAMLAEAIAKLSDGQKALNVIVYDTTFAEYLSSRGQLHISGVDVMPEHEDGTDLLDKNYPFIVI